MNIHWKINALIGALEQTHTKLGMRECQLKAWTDGVWEYEGDATEAFEILARIERRLKAGHVPEPLPEPERRDGISESTKMTVDWLAHHGAAGELKRWIAKHPQREALEAYGKTWVKFDARP